MMKNRAREEFEVWVKLNYPQTMDEFEVWSKKRSEIPLLNDIARNSTPEGRAGVFREMLQIMEKQPYPEPEKEENNNE